MAKENEKKLSADMSSDEMENVSGGYCLWGGVSVPDGVKSIEKVDVGGGEYQINIMYSDGNAVTTAFDANGNIIGSADVFHNGKNGGAAPLPR